MEALERFPDLVHGVSTRTTSDGSDWNLSARRGSPDNPPDPAVALANRHKLASALGITLDRMVGCQQVHGTEVALVGEEDAGRGMTAGVPAMPGVDALIASTPNLFLLALSADCVPVFFYDPEARAVGLAHSGWKGTTGRISASVVSSMNRHFGSDSGSLTVAVGPGIGPCCYSVGPEVVERVEGSFPRAWEASGNNLPLLSVRDEMVFFDLPSAIHRTLVEAGVPPENITSEDVCTGHNLDIFYSHRLERGQCGLFGAVLGMR